MFAGVPTHEQIPPGFPWALVLIGSGDPDEDHPELISQSFDVITGVNVTGDPLGEHAIIGGAVADLGKSAGRGIAEVNERVRAALEKLTGADGAPILLSGTSIDTPAPFGDGRHMTIGTHTFTAVCTSALFYSPAQRIAHNGTDWTWEGTHVSNRFDFLQYRLVRKAGSSPSTDPSDGTVVYTGAPATFTGVKTTSNTYTAFADYNARGGTAVEDSSEPEVGSYLVA